MITCEADRARLCACCLRAGIVRLQRDCPYQVRMVDVDAPLELLTIPSPNLTGFDSRQEADLCFGGPKMPTPAPTPSAPTAANPDIQGATGSALQRAAAAGASATSISGPQGILGANNGAGKTLLGG